MSDWMTTCALAIGSVVALYIGRQALRNRRSNPLPPGPPGIPWVGNVIGLDTGAPWITYAGWARTYGRLQHVRFHILYSIRYMCRRFGLFSAVGKGYYYPQFGNGCKGTTREPVQELFGSSIPHHLRIVGSSFLIMLLTSIHCSRSGQSFNSVFLPYGNRWRLHRRFFHQTFRPESVHRFLPSQHRKACNLLQRLFVAPEHLDDHIFE
jgi:hypothetical protein